MIRRLYLGETARSPLGRAADWNVWRKQLRVCLGIGILVSWLPTPQPRHCTVCGKSSRSSILQRLIFRSFSSILSLMKCNFVGSKRRFGETSQNPKYYYLNTIYHKGLEISIHILLFTYDTRLFVKFLCREYLFWLSNCSLQ